MQGVRLDIKKNLEGSLYVDFTSSSAVRLLSDQIRPKSKQAADNQRLVSNSVGMTGLEPATSRPPDVCANQLRYIPNNLQFFRKACAKVRVFCETSKYISNFLCLLLIFVNSRKNFSFFLKFFLKKLAWNKKSPYLCTRFRSEMS